jgi:hypothetical protein
MFGRMNRKGIGAVFGVILLVMLSVSAATIAAVVINSFVTKSSAQLGPQMSCIDMQTGFVFEIEDACFNVDSGEVEVSIRRSISSEGIEKIYFSISDGVESTAWLAGEECDNCELPTLGGRVTYYFDFSNPEEQKDVSLSVGSCEIDKTNIRACN